MVRWGLELLCLRKTSENTPVWQIPTSVWYVTYLYASTCWHPPLKMGVEGDIRLWRGSLPPCCLSVLSSSSAAVSSSLVFCCKATCVSSCLFASINWICAFQTIQYSQEWFKLCSHWLNWMRLKAFSQTCHGGAFQNLKKEGFFFEHSVG